MSAYYDGSPCKDDYTLQLDVFTNINNGQCLIINSLAQLNLIIHVISVLGVFIGLPGSTETHWGGIKA